MTGAARRRRSMMRSALVALVVGALSAPVAASASDATPGPEFEAGPAQSAPTGAAREAAPPDRRQAAAAAASDDLTAASPGQVIDDLTTLTPTQLAETLAGTGVTVSNVSYTGAAAAAGQFTGMGASGIPTGVMLSSGGAIDAVGPNDSESTTGAMDQAGDADLDALVGRQTRDASALTFTFVPQYSTITIRYAFGSEEYTEFVGSQYNDVFGLFVNGQNCATVDGVAVAVNNVNPSTRSHLYRDNPAGSNLIDLEYDGITTVLTCQAPVNAGVANTLKLAIADTSDSVLDSAVFIEADGVASTTGLRIIQDAQPDDAQDFSYSACLVGSGCSAFSLDDDADATLPNRVTGTGIAPGTYTVTQAAPPAGWALRDLSCDTGEVVELADRRVTITLVEGEQATCVFTNRMTRLTIAVDAQPDDPQDFAYTACLVGSGCSAFSLDDDGIGAPLPRQVTGTKLAPGTYTVTQAAVTGWGLIHLTCTTTEADESIDLAGRSATIALVAGEQVSCTYTNRMSRLTIAVDAEPDDPQDFAYTACLTGSGCSAFSLDDDGGTNATLPDQVTGTAIAPGTFTITQAATAAWTLTDLVCTTTGANEVIDLALRRATITLEPGEQVSCTYTNATTSLTIAVDAEPDDPQDFAYTACLTGSGCSAFSLDDDGGTNATLPDHVTGTAIAPATYTITQAAPPGTWALTDLSCWSTVTDEAIDLPLRRATITLEPGEQVSCTYTNATTSLTIAVDAEPDDPQDFAFDRCVTGGGCTPFSLDDDGDNDNDLAPELTITGLAPGTYTITQAAPPGTWALTDLYCFGDSTVDLDARQVVVTLVAGQSETCVFYDSTGGGSIAGSSQAADRPADGADPAAVAAEPAGGPLTA